MLVSFLNSIIIIQMYPTMLSIHVVVDLYRFHVNPLCISFSGRYLSYVFIHGITINTLSSPPHSHLTETSDMHEHWRHVASNAITGEQCHLPASNAITDEQCHLPASNAITDEQCHHRRAMSSPTSNVIIDEQCHHRRAMSSSTSNVITDEQCYLQVSTVNYPLLLSSVTYFV